MSRRKRENVGSLNNKYIAPHATRQLLAVVNDANAPDGFFLATEADEDAVNIKVFDGSRTWVQTSLLPAIVDFVDPDNYIEGRVYLRDFGGSEGPTWLETGVRPITNTPDIPPNWPSYWSNVVFYRGNAYMPYLVIRQFRNGSPHWLASSQLPPGAWTDTTAAEYRDAELEGQFDGNSYLTLSVVPDANKLNGKTIGTVYLTLLTERTRPFQSDYFVTYWPAAVSAYPVELNSPAGLAGVCRNSHRPPNDDCGYKVRESSEASGFSRGIFKEPYSLWDESWPYRYKPMTRLNSITDSIIVVPFSCKGAGDTIAASHQTIHEDSPISLISEVSQSRNGNIVNAKRTAPQKFYEQNKWQFLDANQGESLLEPPYGNSLQSGNVDAYGNKRLLGSAVDQLKDSVCYGRQAFSIIVGEPSSTCASWSREDEPPPSSLDVGVSVPAPYSSSSYYFGQWLPSTLFFVKLRNSAMDSVYRAIFLTTDWREYGYNNEQRRDRLRCFGMMLLVFSAPQTPYLYFDDNADKWKQNHAKALMADVFLSCRFESWPDYGNTSTYYAGNRECAYVQGWVTAMDNRGFGIGQTNFSGFESYRQRLQLYNQGLQPVTGTIARIPGENLFDLENYYALQNVGGSWDTYHTTNYRRGTFRDYVLPFDLTYLSEA